jgi:hypothetical protein
VLLPLASSLSAQHITLMPTNFSLFRDRLAEACRARDKTETKICQQIGLSSRRSITLALSGPGAIDLWRACQIADVLDVSLDWLTGRSNVMDVMEMPKLTEAQPPKRKPKKVN